MLWVSRTGIEPNCPPAMHFRIFRRAFARKMVITEESQIIRPATSNFCVLCRNSPRKMRILLRLASTKSIKNCNAGGCFAVLSEQILCRCKDKILAIYHIARILSATNADICHSKPYGFGFLRLCYFAKSHQNLSKMHSPAGASSFDAADFFESKSFSRRAYRRYVQGKR